MSENRILKKLEDAEGKRNDDAIQSERRFTQLFERFDGMNNKIKGIHKEVKLTNNRVTSLETWQGNLKAKIATLSAIVSITVSGIVIYFKKLTGE